MRIASHEDLTLEAVEAIAYEGERVELDRELCTFLDERHEAVHGALDGGAKVYGTTTGTGYLGTVAVTERGGDEHSRHLLLGRAVGSGPYLPAPEARSLMAAKLVSLLSGVAGVSAGLCEFTVDRLNDDFIPAVPRTGVGTAGEVIGLSHAFQTFIGVGTVLDARGERRKASQALAERRVEAYRPRTKEGIALLAGAAGTTALAIGRLREARTVARQVMVSAAFAVVAMRAPRGPYAEAAAGLAGDPLFEGVLARFRALLDGAPARGNDGPQAPISFRVPPQVQTHLERVIGRFEADTRRALGAVSDSPAFVDGEFYSTGAFHEIELAAGFDALALAYAHAGELATQRMHRLLDPRASDLPAQLARHPGPNAGLVVVHKRALGGVNELRRLAAPASLGISETSLGQEDAMTFAFEAAEKLRRAAHVLRDVLACELTCCVQAAWLGDVELGSALSAAVEPVRERVRPAEMDRPMGDEIGAVAEWLRGGGWADRGRASVETGRVAPA